MFLEKAKEIITDDSSTDALELVKIIESADSEIDTLKSSIEAHEETIDRLSNENKRLRDINIRALLDTPAEDTVEDDGKSKEDDTVIKSFDEIREEW